VFVLLSLCRFLARTCFAESADLRGALTIGFKPRQRLRNRDGLWRQQNV
jgi:hypothetical protein